MTKEEKIVYLQSQMLCAYIETQAMIADNQDRLSRNQNIGYVDSSFMDVISRYQISSNDVIEFLRD